MKATTFHADLARLLAEKGLSRQGASLAAGLSPGAVSHYLTTKAYPLPDAIRKLALALGADDRGEVWDMEARLAHPKHQTSFATRAAKPRAPAGVEVETLCGHRVIVPLKERDTRLYCSTACTNEGKRSRWILDNRLKERFAAHFRTEQMTVLAAAAAVGISPAGLRRWLSNGGTRLKETSLSQIAAWLGMTMGTAIVLQGGTGEERIVEAARANLQSPKMQRWVKRGQRQHLKKITDEKVRGHPKSAEHRTRISSGRIRYLATHPEANSHFDPHNPNRHTLRARALRMLKALRQHRQHDQAHCPSPKRHVRHCQIWTDDRIEREAVDRLLRPPWSVDNQEAARLLLGLTASANERGGRPRKDARLMLLLDLRSNWNRPSLGEAFWGEALVRVQAVEGSSAPKTWEALKRWALRRTEW